MTAYKPQELPASLQTQLAMYDSTIKDAEAKLAEAKQAQHEMLDEFFGLVGKIVLFKGRRVGVEYVGYSGGEISSFSGVYLRKGEQTGAQRARISSWGIRDGKVELTEEIVDGGV